MSNYAKTKAIERIENLLDENSFVEIGALVEARSTDFNIDETNTPSDGVVTGYGQIDGQLVFVYSQDPDVLGGSIGEMHAKKIVNIYEKAIDVGAPVIGLIDSSGLRLQESVDALEAFGQIYYMQSYASGVIPQISIILGSCGGGLSVVAKLSDFTFMEKSNAKLFVNSPNAIDENKTVKSASAEFQAKAGNVDFILDESQIYQEARRLVSTLPPNAFERAVDYESEDDLNRGVNVEGKEPLEFATEISDNGFVIECKREFSDDIFTGLIKLSGIIIGVIGNKTCDDEHKFTSEGLKKASEFVNTCNVFRIPILTITNVSGFTTTFDTEKNGVSEMASLVYAFASCEVPKVNIIVGEATGSAYPIMNSKALDADMVFAYPTSKVSVMDSEKAAEIIYGDKSKASSYEDVQNNINAVASRGYVDNIIYPIDTRKYLISAFDMLFTK